MKRGLINGLVAIPIVLLNILACGAIMWAPFGLLLVPVFLGLQFSLLWRLRRDRRRIVVYGIDVPVLFFATATLLGNVLAFVR